MLLIVNPRSGMLARGMCPELLGEKLRARGLDVSERMTAAPGDAGSLAREGARQRYEAVVVAGGDGTVREAINGLAGTQVPLGIIPTGTGNVLRRRLGLPSDADAACDVIQARRLRRFDLGLASGRHFILHAGVGHDANVVRRVRPWLKAAMGQWAFALPMVSTILRKQQWQMRVRVDDQTWEGRAWAVIVANSSSYAWKLKLVPDARADDRLVGDTPLAGVAVPAALNLIVP